jgi:Predicted phosphohydrolase
MALYAIGDLHLSLESGKPMDVFGGNWENYTEKIKAGFSTLKPDDLCVVCGDITWAMSLKEAKADFRFIDELPGRKIVLKGNHDYWWTTAAKAYSFFRENDFETIDILHNNCYFYGGTAICGTRGWFYEEETGGAHDKKIMNRELMRLETSLKAAGSAEIICFFHYPPVFKDYLCREILSLLHKYNVKTCCYGHIHGAGHRYAITGNYDGIEFNMVSADHINFIPKKIND